MIKALSEAFAANENSAACIQQTSETEIAIFDCYTCLPSLKRCYIKSKPEEPVHFTLYNPSKTTITFAAVDNCLLGPKHHSRCDFIIGDFNKLYFVEIKQVKTSRRREARLEAVKQLQNSIFLLRNTINLNTTQLVAVICLKAHQARPLQSATRGAAIVLFKEKYNATLMGGAKR